MNINTFSIKQYIDREMIKLSVLNDKNNLLTDINYCINISYHNDYDYLCNKIIEKKLPLINLVFYKDKKSVLKKLLELKQEQEKFIKNYFE